MSDALCSANVIKFYTVESKFVVVKNAFECKHCTCNLLVVILAYNCKAVHS